MSHFFIFIIKIYQKFLSPDHSKIWKWIFPYGYCKFIPSCSDYSILALKKYGFLKGIFKSIWRVFRCNPWSNGGLDLP
jgi:hypothetical protein